MLRTARQTNQYLVPAALLLVFAASIASLSFESWFSRSERDLSLSIGQVTTLTNDIRYKDSRQLAWMDAKKKNPIFWEDSLFSGQRSKAEVKLKNGNRVLLQENSMITFRRSRGKELLQLSMGRSTFHLSEPIQLVASGRSVELEGRDTQITVEVEENSKQMKLTVQSGSVKIATPRGEVHHLLSGENLDISQKKVRAPATSPTKALAPPKPFPTDELIRYHSRFHDLYQVNEDNSISPKDKVEHSLLKTKVRFHWQPHPSSRRFQFQISREESSPPVVKDQVLQNNKIEVSLNRRGTYHWKVRSLPEDSRSTQSSWSENQTVKLTIAVHTNAPTLRRPFQNQRWEMARTKLMSHQFSWSRDPSLSFYLFELSSSKDFHADQTEILWLEKPSVRYRFAKTGRYYWRVRGIHSNLEVTEFSATRKFDVRVNEKLSAPLVNAPPTPLPYQLSRRSPIWWQKVSGARGYEVIVSSLQGAPNQNVKTKRPGWVYPGQAPGKYVYRIRAIDKHGQHGHLSPPKKFEVLPQPVPKPVIAKTKVLKDETSKKREPAQLRPRSQMAKEVSVAESRPLNESNTSHSRSYIQLEGALVAQNTQDRVSSDEGFSSSLLTSLRGMHWWNETHGLEGALKITVANQGDSDSEVNATAYELRHHFRLIRPLNPGLPVRQIHLSLLFGAEVYQNSADGSGQFSEGYNLIKSGAAMKFPVFNSWETGGEFLVGWWFDSSAKYEIQGYINYHFRSKWAVGGGYRLNYFLAGSEDASPDGTLPFREAYGEAYGNLRYSF